MLQTFTRTNRTSLHFNLWSAGSHSSSFKPITSLYFFFFFFYRKLLPWPVVGVIKHNRLYKEHFSSSQHPSKPSLRSVLLLLSGAAVYTWWVPTGQRWHHLSALALLCSLLSAPNRPTGSAEEVWRRRRLGWRRCVGGEAHYRCIPFKSHNL